MLKWEIMFLILDILLCCRDFLKFEVLLLKIGYILFSSIFWVLYYWMQKLTIFWRMDESIQFFYFSINSIGELCSKLLIEISGISLPISTFPCLYRPLSQFGVEHCHVAKSLYSVFSCIAAICISRLIQNTLIACNNDLMWLYPLVLIAHITLCRTGPS